ncbi:MAG: ATP-binding cassette domain-containing protein [Candidatus Pacebacteria bacterium]|nr:ATP-binding cassette domain-containing protein [Candidatus Paceibacterota bacterium]
MELTRPEASLDSAENIVTARNLSKTYNKTFRALDNVSFDVKRGSVTAILGPNGAGKTTTVRILTTLLTPESGSARVAGFDVVRDANKLRSVIGLAGQYAAVDDNLTGRENLEMVGRLYHLSVADSRRRAAELLTQFDLNDAGDRILKTYSGGMRRRLDLAASLVINPKVLFLDEPTTGLDPRGRFALWHVIRELVKDGTTVVLTTQYLEEADQLADKILVIDHGRIIAQGTADELKSQVGGDVVELHVSDREKIQEAVSIISPFGSELAHIKEDSDIITMPVSGGAAVLVDVVRELDAANIKINDIVLRRPSLDDVFMALTGHSAE